MGAATLPLSLHDVVTDGELRTEYVPAEGESLRRIETDPERAKLLRFVYGQSVTSHEDGGGDGENLVADIDLLGRTLLRSTANNAALYYEHTDHGFTVHDVVGDGASALHLVRTALPRMPFDTSDDLTWSDRLPLRGLLPVWVRPWFDVVSPFGVPSSLRMRYATRRADRAVVVEGTSERRARNGQPVLSTTAWMIPNAGLVRVDVTLRGRTRRVEFAGTVAPTTESLAQKEV